MSAPALALLNAAGLVERSSETFRLRYASSADLWRRSTDLERVLAGEADHAVISIDSTPAEIEAIVDAHGTRRVLVTIGGARTATDPARNALLDESLDAGRAIVWLKDLGGRYLRINSRFTAVLGTTEDRVRGHADAELTARETVDGPRLHGRNDATEEPLELEYVVPPFEGRPGFAALRFAVRNRAGEPIAVCGVAAPMEDASVAHAEAARLIEIERFSRLDPPAIRAEFLRSHEMPAHPASKPPPEPRPDPEPRPAMDPGPRAEQFERDVERVRARAEEAEAQARESAARAEGIRADAQAALSSAVAERDAALSAHSGLKRELDEQRREITVLHETAASAKGRAEELARSLDAERERNQSAERALAEARERVARLEQQLQSTEQLEGELQRSRLHIEELRTEARRAQTDVELARARAEQMGREHADARERVARLEHKLELENTDSEEQRRQAERARVEAEHARAEAERARAEADQALADAETARTEAGHALEQAEQARGELEQLRAQSERESPGESDSDRHEVSSSEPAPAPTTASEPHPDDAPDAAAVNGAGPGWPSIAQLSQGLELEHRAPPLEDESRLMDSHELEPAEPGEQPSVQWLPGAQRKLSASLARMSVWRAVLKETTRIIGTEGGWDAVTAWVPDDGGGLECAAMWTAHPGLSAFEALTWDAEQPPAGSLPAQALHAPHLTWVTEIDAVDDDRLNIAADHGLRSALLLPIRDGAVTIGLLELLAHASVNPDAQIAISLEAAALQLGQFGHLLRIGARAAG
ncbi:MAG TPA: PAS domain-containing protein [Solirubrobacteraceae bacterium]|nr:PAS domain-containing protein [Solirubrobacteraceae bacterium]